MPEPLPLRIQRDIAYIDQLIEAYAPLLAQAEEQTPDLVQITALASVLHSFYNGLEAVFTVIAKEIDGELPAGNRWHRDLLEQMGRDNERRTTVLLPELLGQIQNYLAFRHYYRHTYSFFLRWEELQELVLPLSSVWNQTKNALEEFVERLDK